ncbi:MAG: TRAP transporter small permease [Elusimicrobiota bacterium]|jgi:TRAP-type C4-dicarboxylate transport system permease small subunit|nr:TRAP transporter small permease [Elusimicrobiota bacterium]
MKKSFLDRLFRGTEYLMGFLLSLMVIFTFANVVMRYVFNFGLVWSEELASFSFVWLCYIGSIGALRDNRHLFIDTLLSRLHNFPQKVVYTIGQLIILMLMGMLTYGSIYLTKVNIGGNKAAATGLPYAVLYGLGILMGGCMVIIVLANLYKLFVKKVPVMTLLKVVEDVSAKEEGGNTK